MNRRAFLGTLAGGLLATPLVAQAQQAPRVPRVGILIPGSPSDMTWLADPDGVTKKLSELGWTEGRTLALEARWAPNPESYANAAAELVRLGVDVILALGPEATSAAMRATSTVPIVMSGAFLDPHDVGAASLAHPGGNVTGLTIGQAEVVREKRLELLKEALPRISRVAVLWDVDVKRLSSIPDLLPAARSLKVQLEHLNITSVADFDGAFRTAKQRGAGAVLLAESVRALVNRYLIAELGLKHRLPVISQYSRLVEAGALMSYGPDLRDVGKLTAAYVDKILRGAKPADLPIEQPTKYELVINRKTAKALGLTIPQSLLQRADRVIE